MSSNQFDPLDHFNQIVKQAQQDGSFKSENIQAYWEEADESAEQAKRQHEKQALGRRIQTLEVFHKLLGNIENAAEIGEAEFNTAVSKMAEYCRGLAEPTVRSRLSSNGHSKSADTYSSGRPIPRLRKIFDADEGTATVAYFRIAENGQLFLGDRSNKRNIWVNQDWSVLDNTVFPRMYIPRDGEWVEVPSRLDEFDVAWKRRGRSIYFVRIVD